MTFGELLRRRIKELNLSNAEVARRTKFSPTYIGNLVRDFSPNTKKGVGKPSEDAVAIIAKAVDIQLNEARQAAGYASLNEQGATNFDDKVRGAFQSILNKIQNAGYTEAEQKEFIEGFDTMYEIVRERIDHSRLPGSVTQIASGRKARNRLEDYPAEKVNGGWVYYIENDKKIFVASDGKLFELVEETVYKREEE